MARENGWIKLHRKITEHWIWEDPVKLKMWLDLVILVNHEDKKINIGMHLIDCKRGQTITSLAKLADRWKTTREVVRSFLRLLESDTMINTHTTTKYTQISICNYDSYNDVKHTSNTPATHENTTKTQRKHTTKEYKELKNDKDIIEDKSSMSEISDEKVDILKLVDWFNETTKGVFGRVRLPFSETRSKMLNARLRQYGKKAFIEVVENAMQSSFLIGNNHKGFTATFDWLIRPTNFEKVLSGNYDNRNQKDTNNKTVYL